MSENPHSREHIKVVFLSAPLYIAIQKLSAKFEISQKAAILLAVTEGCHSLGLLPDEEYQLMTGRYGRPLIDVVAEEKAKREPSHVPVLTIEKQKEKRELDDKDKQFKGMIEQWNDHTDPNWRIKATADADKWKDKLQSARDLLELGKKTESAI